MNWSGLVLMVIGIIYITLSVLNKNKVSIYNRKEKMVIINSKEFFNLQLKFSVINFLFLVIGGGIITVLNITNPFAYCFIFIFHFIHYLFRVLCKRKGYVTYN